jgi:uncharacterized protein with GYD domain
MAKYLVEVSYSADGVAGLAKDKASGRLAAVKKAAKGLGGSVECFYFAFGDRDAVLIVNLPDNISAAALSLAVAATGMVHLSTTPLLTIEEVDKALAMGVPYRAPGE